MHAPFLPVLAAKGRLLANIGLTGRPPLRHAARKRGGYPMRKKGWKKRLCSGILAAALAVSMAGCGSAGSSTSAASTSNESAASAEDTGAASAEIKVARSSDSSTLDPMLVTNNVDIWMMNLIMEGLVKSSDDGKSVEPCLADSWEISDDGLSYTFHLKQGVKFSNGQDVTTDDWIYSLERVRDTEESAWAFTLSNVSDITAPDADTLVFTLTTPLASFLSDLSLFANVVMPKDYVEQQGSDGIAVAPIGVGPYLLQSWEKGSKMVFVKNPYYYNTDEPVTDTITFYVVPDDNTRIMQLEGGQVDMATDIPFSRVEELKNTSGINMELVDSTESDYISFNYTNEKLKDVRIRQALAYATNRDDIIKAVFYGNATINNTFISPSAPHFNADVTPRDYDVDKAKSLLAEAGASNLELTILITSGDTQNLQVATMLKDQWAKAGVTLNIEQMDQSARSEKRTNLDYDVLLSLLTSDISDTSELMELICVADMAQSMHTGWNGEIQQQAEKLVTDAASEMDEAKRKDEYGQAQQLVQDDQLIVPLYNVPFAVAMSDKVQNFVQTPLGNYRFGELKLAD
jgi:peptide/nickel transport system substrate-binding protein